MHVQFVVPFLKDSDRCYARKLPIVIGRSSEAKFRIPLDSVSRRHCELFEKDGGVFVRDLGSTNGTLLDGELVAVAIPTRVRPGGMIQVGGVAIRIEYHLAAPPEADERAEIRVATLTPADPAGVPPAPPGGALPGGALPGGEPGIAPAVDPPAGTAGAVTPDGGDSRSSSSAASMQRDSTGFSFLGAAAVAEVSPDDENLGDFFKSLA